MTYTRKELLSMIKELEAKEPELRFSIPEDIFTRLSNIREKEQEHFVVIGLDGRHEELYCSVITIGLLDRTLIHPREVFKQAIKENCTAIIVAHNHPSGLADPSDHDTEMTKRLVEAGELIGIPVLDSMIVSKSGYYSYLEKGKLHLEGGCI